MTIWQKAALAVAGWIVTSVVFVYYWNKLLGLREKQAASSWMRGLLKDASKGPLVLTRDRDRPLSMMSMNEREFWDEEPDCRPFNLDYAPDEADGPKAA